MSPRNIPRFELRRLFGLPLLSEGESADAPETRESELTFDLTGENPENRLFGRFGPGELRETRKRKGGFWRSRATYRASRWRSPPTRSWKGASSNGRREPRLPGPPRSR